MPTTLYYNGSKSFIRQTGKDFHHNVPYGIYGDLVGLSGIEFKILRLAMRNRGNYYPATNGPWYLKLLFDLGYLQRFLKRLVALGLMTDLYNYCYTLTDEGRGVYIEYLWNEHGIMC